MISLLVMLGRERMPRDPVNSAAASQIRAPETGVTTSQREIAAGQRFEFGKNWSRFLACLNPKRIAAAEASLTEMLEVDDLEGKRFLDIGCGSGLFSLAARRLGAVVHSFDYDPQSVACTIELKRRYFPEDVLWTIEGGSVLDENYLGSLGSFDVVYSWGVLHHTGQMWKALDHAAALAADEGKLFIAIYNDRGGASRRWAAIKRFYNRSPRPIKMLLVLTIGGWFQARQGLSLLARLQNPLPLSRAKQVRVRGMSMWHDLVDWVGGYPFEVAKPEQIFDFYRTRAFTLRRLKTDGGHGCNEFVFQKARSLEAVRKKGLPPDRSPR
jgi:2-polyprenyl-6-hydroxyphenyl methylase/3-demethylubiquinone-9 3-methyltransferase